VTIKINIGAGKFNLAGWTNIDHKSDHYSRNRVDVDIDLMGKYRFPYKDDSVQCAYTSHVIEHLPEHDVSRMFGETYRVLSRGGIFRITCPDARAGWVSFLANDNEFFRIYDIAEVFNSPAFAKKYSRTMALRDATLGQKFVYFLAPARCEHINVPVTKVTDYELEKLKSLPMGEALDYITSVMNENVRVANPWMHISWWSVDKVSQFLHAAGFRKIYQSVPFWSECLEMRSRRHFDYALPKLSLYVEAVK
jgi:hypothetical protein